MTEPCQVTIVVPVYNAASTLPATIESVRQQSLEDWELFLVDDGSQDDSALICQAAAALDRRIKMIKSPNGGPSAARNLGARTGTAPLIAFLDADDLWHPDRLEGMVKGFAARPRAGILFTRLALFDGQTGQTVTITEFCHRLYPCDLLGEFKPTTSSNIMVKREAFEVVNGFDEALWSAEDQDFVLRVCLQTSYTVRGVNQVWLKYRINPASLSAQLDKMEAGWRTMINKVAAYAPLILHQFGHQAEAVFYRQHAVRATRGHKRPFMALACLFKALMRDPIMPARSPWRSAKALAAVFLALLPTPVLRR